MNNLYNLLRDYDESYTSDDTSENEVFEKGPRIVISSIEDDLTSKIITRQSLERDYMNNIKQYTGLYKSGDIYVPVPIRSTTDSDARPEESVKIEESNIRNLQIIERMRDYANINNIQAGEKVGRKRIIPDIRGSIELKGDPLKEVVKTSTRGRNNISYRRPLPQLPQQYKNIYNDYNVNTIWPAKYRGSDRTGQSVRVFVYTEHDNKIKILMCNEKLWSQQEYNEGKWYNDNMKNLTIPGGRVDPGETYIQAACRELYEETRGGFDINSDKMDKYDSTFHILDSELFKNVNPTVTCIFLVRAEYVPEEEMNKKILDDEVNNYKRECREIKKYNWIDLADLDKYLSSVPLKPSVEREVREVLNVVIDMLVYPESKPPTNIDDEYIKLEQTSDVISICQSVLNHGILEHSLSRTDIKPVKWNSDVADNCKQQQNIFQRLGSKFNNSNQPSPSTSRRYQNTYPSPSQSQRYQNTQTTPSPTPSQRPKITPNVYKK